MDQNISFSDALNTVFGAYGPIILKEPARFCAILGDIAPKLIKERKMVSHAAEEGVLQILWEGYCSSDAEKPTYLKKAQYILKNEVGFSDDWCALFFSAFCEALDWEIQLEASSEVVVPKASNNPTPKAKKTKTIQPVSRKKKAWNKAQKAACIVACVIILGCLTFRIYAAYSIPYANGMTMVDAIAVVHDATEFYKSGDYESAVANLLSLPEGSKEYKDVKSLMKKCESGYCSDVIQTANDYVTNNEHKRALTLLSDSLEIFPENPDLTDSYTTIHSSYCEIIVPPAINDAKAFANMGDYASAIITLRSAVDEVGEEAELIARLDIYSPLYLTELLETVREQYIPYNVDSFVSMQEIIREGLEIIPDNETLRTFADSFGAQGPVEIYDLEVSPDLHQDVSAYPFEYAGDIVDTEGVTHVTSIAPSGWYESSHPYGWDPTYSFAHYAWLLDYQYTRITGTLFFDGRYSSAPVEIELTVTTTAGIEDSWTISNTSGPCQFELDLTGAKSVEISLKQSQIDETFAYLSDVFFWK